MNILVKLGLMKSQSHKDIARSVYMLEFTANAIESMLMSGEYAGLYMCRVLERSGRYTAEQISFMQELIMAELACHSTLDQYLNAGKKYGSPGYVYTDLAFHPLRRGMKGMPHEDQLRNLESRITKSLWYWVKIRDYRRLAAKFRHDLQNIK